jgi:hypothetical protein
MVVNIWKNDVAGFEELELIEKIWGIDEIVNTEQVKRLMMMWFLVNTKYGIADDSGKVRRKNGPCRSRFSVLHLIFCLFPDFSGLNTVMFA